MIPRLSRLQQLTLVLFLILLASALIRLSTGYSLLGLWPRVVLIVSFLVLFLVTTLPPILRRITWRVRNRLILTYVLVGVLPILLIVVFVQLGFSLVLGQTINYMVSEEMDKLLQRLHDSAERRAQDLAAGKTTTSEPSSDTVIVRINGAIVPESRNGLLADFPAWTKPGFRGVVKHPSGTLLLAAHADSGLSGRHAEVFAVRTLDNALLAGLLPGVTSLRVIEGETVRFRIGSFGNVDFKMLLDSRETLPPPAPRGSWDSEMETGIPLEIRSLQVGEKEPAAILTSTTQTAILRRVFSTLGSTAVVIGLFMAIIAGIFLVVEIAAIIASAKLARTLTRTVHDLYAGTKQVESGDFSQRVPVRSKDQLSELVSSFNGMTHRIEQLIGEVREKEKLESELEIARQVQAQLFPKEIPKLAQLELAGVCNPARVVSGDYYDFIPLDSRGAAVVIGDISGKGISAALLMASLQASLHAQLAMDNGQISTATLVNRLNRQLYQNTPPEKYATFYCAVYDDETNRLSYTNAGHLAPILMRQGEVLRLESNGTVVGMFPDYPYEQCDVELKCGDLLVAFTDGITESENAKEEQFGDERLIELVRQNSERPLEEIIGKVMESVGNWAHDPSARDDITVLLARKL